MKATEIITNCFKGTNPNYRSDIDGLRALACLAVVLYHAFPEHLKGGFIGVDIFFVISGFLISSILYKNLLNKDNPGSINIVDFYIRRVRRIFPALIAVLVTCLVLGWLVLFPDEYKLLGNHVFGGSTYISNFILFKESGSYFNVESNAKPLLHLWSLGVEEQFYIVFPLLLWIVYKLNIKFIIFLAVFTVLSFFLNKNGIKHGSQSYVFYMPWTRFWELSAGSILAYAVMFYKDRVGVYKERVENLLSKLFCKEQKETKRIINNVISIIGLALIVYGYVKITNGSKFPGKLALIPVCGALLIIAAGKEAVINKYILSSKPFVFFGLISYPLYLWHWPLLSFAYICEGEVPALWIRISAVGIAILLSVITFYFIEPPLRYGKAPKAKALTLLVFVVVLGIIGYSIKRGYIKCNNVLNTSQSYNYHSDMRPFDLCAKTYVGWKNDRQDHECALPLSKNEDYITLIGDSHAHHLYEGLKSVLNNSNNIALFPASGQIPFIDVYSFSLLNNLQNQKLYKKAWNNVLQDKNAKVIILAHRPSVSFLKGNMIDLANPKLNTPAEIYRDGARRTFKLLNEANKKVIVVLDNPDIPFSPNLCNRKMRLFLLSDNGNKCSFDRSYYDNNLAVKTYNRIVQEEAAAYDNIHFIDLSKYLCDNEYCYLSKENKNLYWDKDGHFNIDGSKYIARYIKAVLDKM